MSKSTKKNDKSEKFIYCSQRHCPHLECLRHDKNIPFNILVLRDKFTPDKNWNCKDIIL